MLTIALLLAAFADTPTLDYSQLKHPVGKFKLGFRLEYKGETFAGKPMPTGITEGKAESTIKRLSNGNYSTTQKVTGIRIMSGNDALYAMQREWSSKPLPTEVTVTRPDGTVVSTTVKNGVPYFKHPSGKLREGSTWPGFVKFGTSTEPAKFKLMKFEKVDSEMCARIEGLCRVSYKGPNGSLERQINMLVWLGLKAGRPIQYETQIRDEYAGDVRVTDTRGWNQKPKATPKVADQQKKRPGQP